MDHSAERPRKNRLKKLLILLISTCIFIFIILLLLPTILSTSAGTHALSDFLSKKSKGKLEIESLSLTWMGPQKIQGMTFSEDKGTYSINCQRIESDASLFSILSSQDLGKMQISEPNVHFKKGLAPAITTPKPVETPKSSKTPPVLTSLKQPFPFTGLIHITKGCLTIESPTVDLISFENLNLDLKVPSQHKIIALDLKGNTLQQGTQGSLAINAIADHIGQADPSLDITAHLEHLPVRGIDQIVSVFHPELSGIILEACGPNLDLDLSGQITPRILQLLLNIKSPQIFGQIQTQTTPSGISLKTPALFQMNLTPLFIQKMANLYDIPITYLQGPSKAQLQITQFSIPFSDLRIDLSSISFQATADLSPMALSISSTPLNITGLSTQLSAQKLTEKIDAQFNASLQSGSTISKVVFSGQAKEAFTDNQEVTWKFSADAFPLSFLDQMLGKKDNLSSWLGNTLTLNTNGNWRKGQGQMEIKASSSFLNISDLQFTLNDQISLTKPTTITYVPNSSMTNRLFPKEQMELLSAQPLQLYIDKLIFPLSLEWEKMKFHGVLSDPLLRFFRFFFINDFALNNLICEVDIDTCSNMHVALKEKNIQANLELALKDKGKNLVLKQPATFTYLLTNDFLQKILSNSTKPILAKDAILKLQIDPFNLSLAPFTLNQLKFKGSFNYDPLSFISQDQSKNVTLKNLEGKFLFSAQEKKAGLDINGNILQDDKEEGIVNFHLNAEDFTTQPTLDFSTAVLSINTVVKNLPTSILEAFGIKGQNLHQIIGNELNLNIDAKSSKQIQTFAIKAASPQLNIDGVFAIKDNLLQIAKTCSIDLTVTPESYPYLDQWLTASLQARPFRLTQPGIINFSIQRMNWPISYDKNALGFASRIPSFNLDWNTFLLSGNLKIGQMSVIENSTGQSIVLKNFLCNFEKNTANAPFSFQLNTSVASKNPRIDGGIQREGQMNINGKLDHLISQNGQFDLSQLDTELQITVQQFPSLILDLFSRTTGNTNFAVSSLFGQTLNAQIAAHIQNLSGPVDINVNSTNIRTDLSGQLQNGVLTLNAPVFAQITMTEEFSKLFLKEVNPLSISAITAQNPITFEINPKGFSVPLANFDVSKVMVPNARIELGQITCQNEGNLNATLGLLRWRQLASSKELKLWFAPMDLHIQNGMINCERTEILISDTFQVATWGNTDLVNDNVDMVLGLTSDCLYKAFGIKDLPEDYVLQIPLKGKTDNVKINTTKATAKIAALLAWQQKDLAGAIGGGTAGAVIGGLLNKWATLPDKNSPVPPAKHPFPWESGKQPAKKPPRVKKSKGIKKDDKPLKQIIKILR